jgi:hypothetical protein
MSTSSSQHGPFLWEQALASLSLPLSNNELMNYYEFDHDDDSDFGVSECDESDSDDSHLDLSISAPTSPRHDELGLGLGDSNPQLTVTTRSQHKQRRRWFPSMTWRNSKNSKVYICIYNPNRFEFSNHWVHPVVYFKTLRYTFIHIHMHTYRTVPCHPPLLAPPPPRPNLIPSMESPPYSTAMES